MKPEQKAFIDQLYYDMYENVAGYINSYLRDELLAQELAQNVFLVAMEKPTAICDSPNPKGWLYRTAKNMMLNNRKTTAHRVNLVSDYLCVYGLERTVFVDSEDIKLKYGNLAQTEEFKLIYDMAILGKSQQEMADERGISVVVCKKRVERAKKYLRRKLQK